MFNQSESSSKKTVLLIGAGAIGTTVAAWIAPQHNELYILDRGEVLESINKNGVSAYLQHREDEPETSAVKTVASLEEAAKTFTPDIIILCVKNYSLQNLAEAVYEQFGNAPVIVALQNGIENQSVLPTYFSKVVYGVVSYNAWLDAPGVAGYQKRGPIVLGTPDNSLQSELAIVKDLFSPKEGAVGLETHVVEKHGVETVITHHLMNAVLSKMIINLTNSFTTLIGFSFKPITDKRLFQTILSQLTYEGVKIVKAAGFEECKLGGMPGWFLISANAKLPQLLTRKLFEKNVNKMVVSSMAQDVIQNHRGDNELESINGYLLSLADQYQVAAPYNRAIYELCQQEFSKPAFEPLSVEAVWQVVHSTITPLDAIN